jgi:hypothetical protein
MRYIEGSLARKHKEYLREMEGKERIVVKFLFFPKKLYNWIENEYEWRWLKKARIRQRFVVKTRINSNFYGWCDENWQNL